MTKSAIPLSAAIERNGGRALGRRQLAQMLAMAVPLSLNDLRLREVASDTVLREIGAKAS